MLERISEKKVFLWDFSRSFYFAWETLIILTIPKQSLLLDYTKVDHWDSVQIWENMHTILSIYSEIPTYESPISAYFTQWIIIKRLFVKQAKAVQNNV